MAYIYKLIHECDPKRIYIGQTVNTKTRLSGHLRDKEPCRKTDWVKSLKTIGLKPRLAVIEEVDVAKLDEREIYWIDYYRATDEWDVLNETIGGQAGSFLGKKHTEEARNKMRVARLGTTASEETRRTMSESKKGNKNRLGIPHTAETRAKMSATRRGKPKSMETRARMSKFQRGRPKSESQRAIIIARNKSRTGMKASPETRQKLSLSKIGNKNRLGIPHTPETRARISATMKEKNKRRKLAKMQSESSGQMSFPCE